MSQGSKSSLWRFNAPQLHLYTNSAALPLQHEPCFSIFPLSCKSMTSYRFARNINTYWRVQNYLGGVPRLYLPIRSLTQTETFLIYDSKMNFESLNNLWYVTALPNDRDHHYLHVNIILTRHEPPPRHPYHSTHLIAYMNNNLLPHAFN